MASLPSRQKCKYEKWHNFILFTLFLQHLTYEGWAKTTVTGWGSLIEGASISALPEKLQKVKVAPINDSVCDAALGAGRIKDVMICAGFISYI